MTKKIVFVGAAGSGKDYAAEFLQLKGYIKSLSHTTRPPRRGETDGIHYHFCDTETFEDMVSKKKFYETASFNNWHYGTSKVTWIKSQVFIMTPVGILNIKPEDRSKCFIVFLDIPEDVRRERVAKRSDADSVERRIEADRLDFENFTDFDVRIENPNFAVGDIITLWRES